jgi:RNA polymerase-binding transcription factor DksA
MRDGTYGRCRACGGGIAPAVLTAIPATTLCGACHPG